MAVIKLYLLCMSNPAATNCLISIGKIPSVFGYTAYKCNIYFISTDMDVDLQVNEK